MFSTTIKRSVATLGVVAGILAAAGPASAAGGGDDRPTEQVSVKAVAAGTQVGSEGLALDDYGPHLPSVGAGKDRGWAGSARANAAIRAGGELIGDL